MAITAVAQAERTGVEMEALTSVTVAALGADRHDQGGGPRGGDWSSRTCGSRKRPAARRGYGAGHRAYHTGHEPVVSTMKGWRRS